MAIIDYIEIEEIDVISTIDEITLYLVTSHDGFSAILLKKCKRALAKPLQILFQSLLTNKSLTRKLKAGMCTIHKRGRRADAKICRPAPLTSHISNVIERFVKRKLITFLEDNAQHGFLSGRNCLTQLLQHYTWMLKQLMNLSNVDAIYLDFVDTFAKVDMSQTTDIRHSRKTCGVII